MTETLSLAETIAVEHYLWLRAQRLTHRLMYASIDEEPPVEFRGGDGVVQALAAKWLTG